VGKSGSIQSKFTIYEINLPHVRLDLRTFTLHTSLPHPGFSFLTKTGRGSNRTEVGEDGEDTPAAATTELLVIASEEAPAITLDLGRGSSWLGRK
jgi:hypothetical protein